MGGVLVIEATDESTDEGDTGPGDPGQQREGLQHADQPGLFVPEGLEAAVTGLVGRLSFGAGERENFAAAAQSLTGEHEVLEHLDGDHAYTTVTTVLDRLARKGLAEREPRGRAIAYRPLRTETAITSDKVRALLDTGHDRSADLQGLVAALSDADADELQQLLLQAHQARTPPR